MNNDENPNSSSDSIVPPRATVPGFVAVVIVWILGVFVWAKFASLGSASEAIGALFSGLAFGGLLITILIQIEVIRLTSKHQSEEIARASRRHEEVIQLTSKHHAEEIERASIRHEAELRKTTEVLKEQIEVTKLTRLSILSGLVPYILVGMTSKPKETISTEALGLLRIELPHGINTDGFTRDSGLYFHLKNKTPHIASHILCIYWDGRNDQFFRISELVEVLGPNEDLWLPMKESRLTTEQLKALLQQIYEDRGSYYSSKVEHWATQKASMIIPLFFDISGLLFSTPRLVYKLDGQNEFAYSKSDLLYDVNQHLENFAPPFSSTARIFGSAKD